MTENYEDESLLSVENETELIELLKKRYQNGNQFVRYKVQCSPVVF